MENALRGKYVPSKRDKILKAKRAKAAKKEKKINKVKSTSSSDVQKNDLIARISDEFLPFLTQTVLSSAVGALVVTLFAGIVL